MICKTYGYALDYVRSLDATDYWYLYEQAIRLEALERQAMLTAINAGMNGGEPAEELMAQLRRVVDGLPKIRVKQSASEAVAMYLVR